MLENILDLYKRKDWLNRLKPFRQFNIDLNIIQNVYDSRERLHRKYTSDKQLLQQISIKNQQISKNREFNQIYIVVFDKFQLDPTWIINLDYTNIKRQFNYFYCSISTCSKKFALFHLCIIHVLIEHRDKKRDDVGCTKNCDVCIAFPNFNASILSLRTFLDEIVAIYEN